MNTRLRGEYEVKQAFNINANVDEYEVTVSI